MGETVTHRILVSALACVGCACSSAPRSAARLVPQAASEQPAGAQISAEPPDTAVNAPAAPRRVSSARFDPGANYPTVSPFRAMRQSGDNIEVQVDDDTWYIWVSLDGIAAAEVVAWARANLADQWWKRLNEDLPQVLALAGAHDGNLDVTLGLRNVATGESVTLTGVTMTENKRRTLKRALRGGGQADALDMAALLPPDQWRADVAQFEDILEQRFAYRHLGGVDVAAEMNAIRARLGTGAVPTWQLSRELSGLLGQFADGHAGIIGDGRILRPLGAAQHGELPFLLQDADGGVVAFRADRSGFAEPGHPYVTAMDGRPIETWIAAASEFSARGSAQYIRHSAFGTLRRIQSVRVHRGWDAPSTIRVRFADARGHEVDRTVDLAHRAGRFASWPRTEDDILADNIGYLRIALMDSGQVERIDAAMKRFAGTDGLIIDVRGNGGGSRDILRGLFPYFMSRRDRPHVANVAAYRLAPDAPRPRPAEGYLPDRFLYPADHAGFSEAKKRAIRSFARGFKPTWQPRRGDFSEWHYMVIDRSDNPAAYHYDKPVVILMNSRNFSATDIFLAAFKGWRNVTLMGTASGGGSARTESYVLRHSKLIVLCASMASFQPSGPLYDGVGVTPDVVMKPEAGYFIGASDKVLDAARVRLRARR